MFIAKRLADLMKTVKLFHTAGNILIEGYGKKIIIALFGSTDDNSCFCTEQPGENG
jgi:hypothetical protein